MITINRYANAAVCLQLICISSRIFGRSVLGWKANEINTLICGGQSMITFRRVELSLEKSYAQSVSGNLFASNNWWYIVAVPLSSSFTFRRKCTFTRWMTQLKLSYFLIHIFIASIIQFLINDDMFSMLLWGNKYWEIHINIQKRCRGVNHLLLLFDRDKSTA